MPSSNKTKNINIRIKPLHLDYGEQRTLYFPAIITNFKNSYDTKWQEEEVYGRMDPLGSFNSTSRKISLGFKIVSTTELEAQDNMMALSAFYTYLYPKYKGSVKDSSIIQKPPYFEIAFLNFLVDEVRGTGVKGYITNFQADTPFGSEDTSLYYDSNNWLFTDVNVSIDMRVLHQFPIGWYDDQDIRETYPYGIGGGTISTEILDRVETENSTRLEELSQAEAALDYQRQNATTDNLAIVQQQYEQILKEREDILTRRGKAR